LKILILKPSSLGDVVQALPVLRLLKLHLPHSEIFWWLESGLIPLLEDDPDLAGILPFERNHWAAPARWPEIWAGIRAMRGGGYDWAIDLQGLARSGFNTWLANADLSIGLDNAREGAREGARLFYDLIAPRSAPGTHAVDRYLAVLPELGVPVHAHFQWLPARPGVAAMVHERWRPESARWVALLPGARWETKRWPLEYFQELARRLPGPGDDLKFVILGGKDDRDLGAAIVAANPERCLDLTGHTSLPELIEWVRLCELVITNDSGPMHIAAALGRPVIAMFGPTDPRNTGPYGQAERVIQMTCLPCVPCMKGQCAYERPLACLRDITPAMVCERARTAMSAAAASMQT
jgi:lipopolysaccharide heptosyltransferase II